MNSKTKIILIAATSFFSIICLLLAFGDSTTSKANESGSIERKIEDLAIDKKQERTKITAKYQIEPDKPVLILYSSQIKNLDLKKLKEDLSEKNVGVDLEKELIHLYMKDQISADGRGTLTFETINQNQTYFEIRDIDHQIMKSEFLNQPTETNTETESKPVNNGLETDDLLKDPDGVTTETSQITENDQPTTEPDKGFDGNHVDAPSVEINDNENDPKSGWQRKTMMQITKAPAKELPNGSTAHQVIYFGAINYALEYLDVKESVSGRDGFFLSGNGRENNITAANSAVIIVPEGGKLDDKQQPLGKIKYEKNKWITNTFGDGYLHHKNGQVQSKYGSQRNFVTTNLFDYEKPSKDFKIPNLIGPDNEKTKGTDKIAMIENTANLYINYSPRGSEYPAQRIVYEQKGDTHHIKTRITQGFNPDGSIYVRTQFENIGKYAIPNFTGYAFRDITFMQNHNYSTMEKDNILRSLGNNRGAYATRKAYNGSLEFHMDTFKDAPYGWAAQGTKSTYFTTRGDIDKDHPNGFPWKDNPDDQYERPFTNIDDQANALPKNEPGLGQKLAKGNKVNGWDSGISMHTKNQVLYPGERVSMAYSIDVVPISNHPMIELHQSGTYSDPLVLQSEQDQLSIDGGWFHFGHPSVELKYLMKPANATNSKEGFSAEEIAKSGTNIWSATQKPDEQKVGKRFPWNYSIPTKNLKPGKYLIGIVAVDKSDNELKSTVKHLVIEIPKTATKEPQLEITAPSPHSITSPFEPKTSILNIKGVWSDNDSESITLSYRYDDETPVILLDKEKNLKGQIMPWQLPEFNIEDINDTKLHKIDFMIDDHDPTTVDPTKTFYFARKDGTFQFFAPREIRFGTHNLISGQQRTAKPELYGGLKVKDFRKDNSSPIRITLQTANFTSEENQELDTSVIFDQTHFPAGQKLPFKEVKNIPGEWLTVTDYTKQLEKELKLKLKRPNDTSDGTFKSHWVWEACDSIS